MDTVWGLIFLGFMVLLVLLNNYMVRQHKAVIIREINALGGKSISIRRRWFTWNNDFQYDVSYCDASGEWQQTHCKANLFSSQIYWTVSPREAQMSGPPFWGGGDGGTLSQKMTDDVRQRHKVWDVNR